MANKIKQKTKNKEIYCYRPDLQKFNRSNYKKQIGGNEMDSKKET